MSPSVVQFTSLSIGVLLPLILWNIFTLYCSLVAAQSHTWQKAFSELVELKLLGCFSLGISVFAGAYLVWPPRVRSVFSLPQRVRARYWGRDVRNVSAMSWCQLLVPISCMQNWRLLLKTSLLHVEITPLVQKAAELPLVVWGSNLLMGCGCCFIFFPRHILLTWFGDEILSVAGALTHCSCS